jgi:hypothetical protein
MIIFLIITLGVSLVGMTTLLALKRYELATGRVLFWSMRPRLNRLFFALLYFVERRLPRLVREGVESGVAFVRREIHKFIAKVIVFSEFWLQRALDFLHLTTHAPHPTTPASAFLREVAEHKRNLLRHAHRPRIVVQE